MRAAFTLALVATILVSGAETQAQSSSGTEPPTSAFPSPPAASPPAAAPPPATAPPPAAAPPARALTPSAPTTSVPPPAGATASQPVTPPPTSSTAPSQSSGPAAPPASRSGIPESCDDGILNGPESDVDCGGDCPPCERKSRCQHASDCWSGLCADGVCEERRAEPGAPIPPGYDTELARSDAAASVRLVGTLFLGVGYGSAYIAALSYPGGIGALYVPVAGPWLTLKEANTIGGKAVLAANGAIQGAGAILLIGGVVGAGRQLVRKEPADEPEEARVRIVPALSSRRVGVVVHGRF